MPVGERRDEVVRDRRRALRHRAALTTDEVKVLGVVGPVVRRRVMVQMGMRDEPGLLERVQRAIDRGRRNRRLVEIDELGERLGSCVR